MENLLLPFQFEFMQNAFIVSFIKLINNLRKIKKGYQT